MRGALGVLVLLAALVGLLYLLAEQGPPEATAPLVAPLAEGTGPTLQGDANAGLLSESELQEAREAARLHAALLPLDRAARIAHLRAYLRAQSPKGLSLPFSQELAALLIELFRKSARLDAGETASWLEYLGPRAAPLVVDMLEAGVPQTHAELLLSLFTVWRLRDPACPLPDLLPYLSEEGSVSKHLALRLLRAGVPYEEALADRLVEMFRARLQWDPQGPGAALARMGPEGVARLLAILDAAERESERVAVLQLLSLSTPECLRSHLPTLLALMNDPGAPAYTRATAVYALVGMRGECESCLPTLRSLLRDETYEFITPCLRVLGQMGTKGAPAVPDLIPWLESDDPKIADQTAQVLGEIGGHADLVVPALGELVLRAGSDAGARALGTFGAAALPHAQRILADGDEYARYAILWTFAGLGEQAASMVPTLLALVDGDDDDIALRAIGTLGYIGPKAEAAVPAIMKRALQGESHLLARDAAATLMRLGPRAEEALLVALRTRDRRTEGRAAEILAHFHLRSAFALRELKPLTGHGERTVRMAAYRAIAAAAYSSRDEANEAGHALPPLVLEQVQALLERGRTDKDAGIRAEVEGLRQRVLYFSHAH